MGLQQMRKLWAAGAVAFGFIALAAPVAFAAYGTDGGLTVQPTTIPAGGDATVDSTGWKASSDVTITLHSDPVVLATVSSDASGAVHASVTVPAATAAGAHTVVLTGSDSTGAPREMSSAITVTAGGGGGSLPRTGAAIAALVVVGIALFAGGGAMSAARKRATR